MVQTRAKIYYLIATGDVLIIMAECQGSVMATTKDEDMATLTCLKGSRMDEVDYIELPYGTLATTFTNVKSYSINVGTRSLECVYYTQEELDSKTSEVELGQALASRMSAINEYVQAQDETALATIEDAILQMELNKILNGGM